MKETSSSIVLLNSGGIDSLACAKILTRKGHQIHSLYIDIGQTNRRPARRAAKKIAKKYAFSHTCFRVFPRGFLLHLNKRLQLRCPPFQDALLWTIGAAWTRARNIDFIASGQKSDASTLEADEAFMALQKTSRLSEPVIFVRPLRTLRTLEDVYPIVKRDPLLFETVSCRYTKWGKPCKKCPECENRSRLGID